MLSNKQIMVTEQDALVGRASCMQVPELHYVFARPMLSEASKQDDSLNKLNCPEGMQYAMFGLGCFWGAERKFWQLEGVYLTAAGYAAGFTPNPCYEEVCTGLTGHNEVVQVVFDPHLISFADLLAVFWESHNPTQGMRQGNDRGTQYRSGIYVYGEAQLQEALASRERYQSQLSEKGYSEITTEILTAPTFYFAEGYHQQYLAKNPSGYCGLGGTGVNYA